MENKAVRIREKYHGIIQVESKVAIDTPEALSDIYAPGVGVISLLITEDEALANTLTFKGKTIAVISNGTAVLGYGNIGSSASLPVIEAKAAILKKFADVDAFPISIDTESVAEFVSTVKNISKGFAGIHLEDIKAPECFMIEKELQDALPIPVYHDDQHGTAMVVLAGLINALKLVEKNLFSAKIVISGMGASGIATARLLHAAGAKNLVLCDKTGVIDPNNFDTYSNSFQKEIALEMGSKIPHTSLSKALEGADVFIGLSVGKCVTQEMISSMPKDSIVFALANPVPEILPEIAYEAGARIVATGSSQYPNQVNNLLVFPGLFRGLLDNPTRRISEHLKIKIANELANIISEKELSEDNIIPSVFDKEVVAKVASSLKSIK